MTEDIVTAINQISGILDSYPIDEIGIIVGSPDPFVHVENKLGIAHTLIKPLYKCSIEKLCTLDTLIGNNDVLLRTHWKSVHSMSRMLLLIKGDFPLAFKLRKQMIELEIITIASEISLLLLIFGRTPKTPSGWFHRRWCLLKNATLKGRSKLSALEIESEREICRKFAEASPKNYYCWMYRLWLLDHMTDSQLIDELTFTSEWLVGHVSDHSACSHRIYVIYLIVQRLISSEAMFALLELKYVVAFDTYYQRAVGFVFAFLFDCLRESETLIEKRPGHESLWYHRRSLFIMIVQLIMEIFKPLWPSICALQSSEGVGSILSPMNSYISTPEEENSLTYQLITLIYECKSATSIDSWLFSFLVNESIFCHKCIENRSDVWDYEAQKTMSLRYTAFILDTIINYLSHSHPGLDLKIQDIVLKINALKSEAEKKYTANRTNEVLEECNLLPVCKSSLNDVKIHLKECSAVFRL